MPGWSAALCGRHLSMVWRKEGEQRALEVFSYARERVRLASPVGSALHPALQPGPSGQRAVGPRTQLEKVWQGDEVTLVVPVSGPETSSAPSG